MVDNTKAKWWVHECVFLTRQSLYSNHLCIHCKTLDVHVFNFRLFLCWFLEGHWVLQGTAYLHQENETSAMKSPLSLHHFVQLKYMEHHVFLTVPHQIALAPYLYPHLSLLLPLQRSNHIQINFPLIKEAFSPPLASHGQVWTKQKKPQLRRT